MVDLLVSSGLKKAGYEYFVIDGEPLTLELWPANSNVDVLCTLTLFRGLRGLCA